jgi:hypothetical protein
MTRSTRQQKPQKKNKKTVKEDPPTWRDLLDHFARLSKIPSKPRKYTPRRSR